MAILQSVATVAPATDTRLCDTVINGTTYLPSHRVKDGNVVPVFYGIPENVFPPQIQKAIATRAQMLKAFTDADKAATDMIADFAPRLQNADKARFIRPGTTVGVSFRYGLAIFASEPRTTKASAKQKGISVAA